MSVEDKQSSPDPLLLQCEYEILQGKIDKIGEFRFKVRGWALTLILGLFAAAASWKANPTMATCGGVFLTLLFYLLEREQDGNYDVLRRRTYRVEKLLGSGPKIVASFATASAKKDSNETHRTVAEFLKSDNLSSEFLKLLVSLWRKAESRLVSHIKMCFYGSLFLASLFCSCAPDPSDIGRSDIYINQSEFLLPARDPNDQRHVQNRTTGESNNEAISSTSPLGAGPMYNHDGGATTKSPSNKPQKQDEASAGSDEKAIPSTSPKTLEPINDHGIGVATAPDNELQGGVKTSEDSGNRALPSARKAKEHDID